MQSFSHRSEISEPHIRPLAHGSGTRKGLPEHQALKASRVWLRELHRTGIIESSLLKGTHKSFVHKDQGQSSNLVSAGLGESAEVGEGWLWLTLGTQTHVADIRGSIHLCEFYWRLTFFVPRSDPISPHYWYT